MPFLIVLLLLSISWGNAIIIGYAEQSHAPAILPYGSDVLSVWVDVEDNKQFHVLHLGKQDLRLPFASLHPHKQRLYPAYEDLTHLLWVDASVDESNADNHLWIALIRPDLSIERGPIQVSTIRTDHYSVAPNDDRSLTLVWSGGSMAEPTLYIQYIDATSRPQPAKSLLSGGHWPTLVRNQGTLYLFWISDDSLYRGIINDNRELEAITRLTHHVQISRTDRLDHMTVSLDTQGQAYALWTVVDMTGHVHSWMANGLLNDTNWPAPIELANMGWHSPAQGDLSDTLVIAALRDNRLELLYFAGGVLVNSEPIVTLEAGLIGPPNLYKQADQYYLSWSEPIDRDEATLKIIRSNS